MAELEINQNNEAQEPQEGEAERNLRLQFVKLSNPETVVEAKPEEAKPGITADPEKKADAPEPEKKEEAHTEPEKDNDLKDLPEDKPTPDHWKELRKRYAELKKQVKAKPAESTIAAMPDPHEARYIATMPTPAVEAPAAAKQDRIPADNVFNVIARVANGELDASYKAEAEKYITSEMTPAELVEVFRKAQNGYFGDNSETIKDAAAKFLPVVRETSVAKERETVAVRKATETRAKSWQEVKTMFPTLDMNNPATPEYAEIKSAHDALIQQFPDLWQRPEAPAIIARYAKERGQMSKAATYEKELALLRAENAELKKQTARKSAPLDTGGGSSTTKKTPEQELAENLSRLWPGR